MNVIRPKLPPVPGQVPQGDPARLEAKRALFAEAFGKAAGAGQAQTSAPAVPSVQAAPSAPVSASEPPRKILRPGSLIDIRV